MELCLDVGPIRKHIIDSFIKEGQHLEAIDDSCGEDQYFEKVKNFLRKFLEIRGGRDADSDDDA